MTQVYIFLAFTGNMRIEWGRPSVDKVGEEGFLVSELRATSIVATCHPWQRSTSSDWNLLTPSSPVALPPFQLAAEAGLLLQHRF